ncbi:APC family permease [Catenulispora sp. NF23]|uniref:APC family permease n=2 Tax=Catenulispora pinistramenti TaxID=2705254 RepID=A0ABS5KJE9_9ACTN|nr:APC family permease [Catenulispora pinistramenti]MBS2546150.1 APC family permease [Catenulispora pinistramenti]
MSAALAKDRLGAPAVGFFILAGVAPLTVTEGVVPSAFAATGLTSVPAAFLVVAAVLAVFVIGYLAMARRIPNAGAAYALISKGLGKPAGMAGWLVAVVAYNLLQVGLYGMIGPQLASFAADNFGLHASWGVWAFGAWAVVAVLGLLRVDLSGWVLGVLSVLELVVIVAVTIRGLAHPADGGVSFAALSPASLHFSSLGPVLAVAVLGFVGIEQGPVFSEEARNPKRTIPMATYISLGVIAVVYAAASWALVVHYGSQVVPTAQGPDGTGMLFAMAPGLEASTGRSLFLTSLLAAALAFHTAVGRYMWAVGRERVLPAAMGTTGSTGAPQAASIVQSLLGAVAILLALGMHWDPIGQLFFWGGTTGGVGILLLLTAASAAVVRYFWTSPGDEPVWRRLVAPAAATVLMAVMAWLCITHFDVLLNVAPGSLPTKVLPGLFGAAAIIGASWALVLRHRKPAAYAAIGLGSVALSQRPTTAVGTEAPSSATRTGNAS